MKRHGRLAQSILALSTLAALVGRGRQIDETIQAFIRKQGAGFFRNMPGVLADVNPDTRLADLKHGRPCTRYENPLFVKDPLVRQKHLAVGRHDPAAREDCRGVACSITRPKGTTDDDYGVPRQIRLQGFELPLTCRQKLFFSEPDLPAKGRRGPVPERQ